MLVLSRHTCFSLFTSSAMSTPDAQSVARTCCKPVLPAKAFFPGCTLILCSVFIIRTLQYSMSLVPERITHAPHLCVRSRIASAFLLHPVSSQAQVTTVSGYVQDQGAGMVPGATVTAELTGQRLVRARRKSNGTGFFDLQLLPRGTYVVKVRSQDFRHRFNGTSR